MTTADQIHLGSTLDAATLDSLADFICGDNAERYPVYRSSTYLTRFFDNSGVSADHDGSTRKWWVLGVLQNLQPAALERVILRLVDLREYKADKKQLALAAASMNDILAMDGLAVAFDGARPKLIRGTALSLTTDDLTVAAPSGAENEFLQQQFSDTLRVDDLNLDTVLTPILQSRIDEIQACPRDRVHLGTILLLGSTLEGILIGVASKNLTAFMTGQSAPKDKAGKPRPIHEWRLAQLIDTAHELRLLGLDVKKFSHALRDFRNYIHPYEQMAMRFNPDQHTVDICWQVFKAAFAHLRASTT